MKIKLKFTAEQMRYLITFCTHKLSAYDHLLEEIEIINIKNFVRFILKKLISDDHHLTKIRSWSIDINYIFAVKNLLENFDDILDPYMRMIQETIRIQITPQVQIHQSKNITNFSLN